MRRVDHPRLIAALRQVEDSIDEAWRQFCAESGITAGTADERELADVVLQDTSEFDWRVVDGALKQLTCTDCGSGLGAGPTGCASCDQANGFRFAAREIDRAGVPPGNEHAIRVSSAVARPGTGTHREPAPATSSTSPTCSKVRSPRLHRRSA